MRTISWCRNHFQRMLTWFFINQGPRNRQKRITARERKFGSQIETRGSTHHPLPRPKPGEICMKLLKLTNNNLFQVSFPPVMLLNWGQIACQMFCPGTSNRHYSYILNSGSALTATDEANEIDVPDVYHHAEVLTNSKDGKYIWQFHHKTEGYKQRISFTYPQHTSRTLGMI